MNNLIKFIMRIVIYLRIKIFKYNLLKKKYADIDKNIKIAGIPMININSSGLLTIGKNVTLGSLSYGNHFNMHSPVKLMIDRDSAIIKIGDNTRIFGTCIHAQKSIIIGDNCLISANCQIIDSMGHDFSFENTENRINTAGIVEPILIKNNVWIGSGSIILPGVTIGEGSVITVNSVIDKDVPAMVLAGGNPMKVLKTF